MAVTQYIGARYVPKFFEGEDGTPTWVSGVQYEPLTIVTYNGNSYTSKKPVPASVGNPSANPAYWASTGMYNEQVEILRQEFEQFRTDTTEDVEEIQNDLQTLEENTAQKFTEVCWFGDSYVQANSLGSDQNKRFATLVSASLGLTEHNYATGGSDFLSGGDSGLRYSDQLTNAINELTDAQKSKTQYVIVAGTRNMPYNSPNASLSDYNTAIGNWFTRAHETFPNAILVFIPMLWSAEPLVSTYRRCVQWCMQCALNTPFPIMTIDKAWLWLMGMYSNVMSDNVHPNVNGHRLLAAHIYSAIMGENITAAPIFTDLTISNGTGGFHLKVIDGKMYINGQFTLASAGAAGRDIVTSLNLGNGYGFIISDQVRIPAYADDGSMCVLQVSNYHASNNINFGIKLYSACDANKYYYVNNAVLLNGIQSN